MFDFFKRKKKSEKEVKHKLWEDEEIEDPNIQREDPASFKFFVVNTLGSLSQKIGAFHRPRIHRIPYFRGLKRMMAGIYFLFFMVAGVFSFSSSPMGLMFFGAAFIFLDYLWKTRRR